MKIALILLSVALNALAQVFLRHGMRGLDSPVSLGWLWSKVTSLSVLAGLGCYGVSVLVWLFVLSRVQVSVAYPFQAVGYVLASLVAWRFLGEGVTALNVLGLTLICMGVVLLSRSGV